MGCANSTSVLQDEWLLSLPFTKRIDLSLCSDLADAHTVDPSTVAVLRAAAPTSLVTPAWPRSRAPLTGVGLVAICRAASEGLRSVSVCQKALPHVTHDAIAEAIALLPHLVSVELSGQSLPHGAVRKLAVMNQGIPGSVGVNVRTVCLEGGEVGVATFLALHVAFPQVVDITLRDVPTSIEWRTLLVKLKASGSPQFPALKRVEVNGEVTMQAGKVLGGPAGFGSATATTLRSDTYSSGCYGATTSAPVVPGDRDSLGGAEPQSRSLANRSPAVNSLSVGQPLQGKSQLPSPPRETKSPRVGTGVGPGIQNDNGTSVLPMPVLHSSSRRSVVSTPAHSQSRSHGECLWAAGSVVPSSKKAHGQRNGGSPRETSATFTTFATARSSARLTFTSDAHQSSSSRHADAFHEINQGSASEARAKVARTSAAAIPLAPAADLPASNPLLPQLGPLRSADEPIRRPVVPPSGAARSGSAFLSSGGESLLLPVFPPCDDFHLFE